MSEPVIALKNVSKHYLMGENVVKALDHVSLNVDRGEFVAILGPSGSGKSTLMNIIGCIDIVDEGDYILDGKDIKVRDEDELADVRNQKVGFVFQKFNLLAKFTAIHNVALPLLLRGVGRAEAYHEAEALLVKVGLGERLHHKPNELSGGQQQRVSIARAMVGKPDILLADEPTGALDSQSGEEILKLFHAFHEEGVTIIVITHDQEVADVASRIVTIKDGRFVTG